MYNLTQIVDPQNKALTDSDITEVQRLLTELETHLEKKRGWKWLRTNKPESYNELYTKLKDLGQVLLPAGKSTMRQLVSIFKWCEDHDISLAYLGVSENLHKYREATAYLIRIINNDATTCEIKREVLDAIRRIKSDKNRDLTRLWVRKKRTE